MLYHHNWCQETVLQPLHCIWKTEKHFCRHTFPQNSQNWGMFCVLYPPPQTFFMLNQSSFHPLTLILEWRSLLQEECLNFLITQAPALFGLVVSVTEAFMFTGTQFSLQKELSEVPWGGQTSQDMDLAIWGCFADGCAPPLPAESSLHYTQLAATQGLLAGELLLNRFLRADLRICSVPRPHPETS